MLGGLPAAHLCKKHTTISGLVFPTHRYVVPTNENGQVLSEPVLVTIDLTHISVTWPLEAEPVPPTGNDVHTEAT